MNVIQRPFGQDSMKDSNHPAPATGTTIGNMS